VDAATRLRAERIVLVLVVEGARAVSPREASTARPFEGEDEDDDEDDYD
jgi:hypothetical protein